METFALAISYAFYLGSRIKSCSLLLFFNTVFKRGIYQSLSVNRQASPSLSFRFSTRYFGICQFFSRYWGIECPPMPPPSPPPPATTKRNTRLSSLYNDAQRQKTYLLQLKALANEDALLRTHCCNTNVSPFVRARNICCGHTHTKNVSDFVQKHFVPATNVSQFAQPKKHHGQQCVLVYQGLKVRFKAKAALYLD